MIKLPKTKNIAIHGPRPKGLRIDRDEHGIPHIHADNLNDLNWGLGYCHAVDRGMQLQFMRILGQGRLCELLDDSEESLQIDKFFRRVGWKHHTASVIESIEPEALLWCQALCDGINAGLHTKRFSLMRMLSGAPEPWTLEDTVLVFRMAGYLTLAQTQGESERLFVELLQNGVSDEKLASIFPISDQSYDRDLLEKVTIPDRIIPLELLWQAAIPRMMASNNWVVSGDRTASGNALMANDPHLEVNRLPNVWYEAAMSCPEYQGTGYGMPGIPGLLIGRTRDLAWGATYTFADTVDSWVEQCKDGKYKRGKTWRKFEERKEHIVRKKNPDHLETFYECPRGILEGDPNQEGYYLSTAWSPATYGAASLNSAFQMMRAKTTKEAQQALGGIESAWNWVISDSEGDIAYQMSGLCPKRKEGWNGFVPGIGWDSTYDWQGFHKLEDLPQSYNPKAGYFVTANQDLNAFGKVDVINMPMANHRARRIEALLSENDKQSVGSTRDIQMDTFSLHAQEYLKVLKPLIDTNDERCTLAEILLDWDLHYDKHSTGAVLFERFYSELRKLVFQDEQISPALIKHLSEETCLFIDFYQNFDRCLLDQHSIWFAEKSQSEMFLNAFNRAKTGYEAITWGDKNRFTFTNILTQGKLPKFLGFDSEPLPMIGGRATPHQGQIYSSNGRSTSFAGSVRIVADMGEALLHSRTAGGASDNPLSPWYMSEVQGWLDGTYKRVKL